MTWEELKQSGSTHYQGGDIQPIDLHKSGGMLWDFAVASIIKYAYRNRKERREHPYEISVSDMEKIQHYAEMLKTLQSEAAQE